MIPLAHSVHWLIDLAYVAPFIGLLGWLFATTIRDRRRTAREKSGERPDA